MERADGLVRRGGLALEASLPGIASLADMGEGPLWAAFADAADDAEFCAAWLALQCRLIPSVRAGVVLIERDGASFAPAAIWPDPRRDVTHLRRAAEKALAERRGVVLRPDDDAPGSNTRALGVHIAYPIEVGAQLYGVIVLDAAPRPESELQAALRQLHWGAGWLESMFWRRRSDLDRRKVGQAGAALDVLAVAEEHARLEASCLAVANELAQRFDADRVSIGFRKRNRVRLKSMSHAAWFQKRSRLVGNIENAMEEALDQHASVVLPSLPGAERRISVAHRDFTRLYPAKSLLTVVMTAKGKPLGAILLERHRDIPFNADDLALGEAVGALVGPVLELKAQQRKLLSGRLVEWIGTGFMAVFGARKPALKLGLIAVIAAGAWIYQASDLFRVSAKSVLEGAVQRSAVAPFEGFVAQAPVRAGDLVGEGQVMAVLDDKDLQLERMKWVSEQGKLGQRLREAHAKHDRVNVGTLSAQLRQAEAQLALVDEKIGRTRIRAPIAGIVVTGDLSQMLGSPIERGKVLFEVAPLDAYRVILQVDERDVRHLGAGQTGELALNGLAGQALSFEIRKIVPVTKADEGRNYFRVEAALVQAHAGLRPGMEGIAKVEIGDRPLWWIWTRTLVEWAQLTWWKWAP